jgi:hypothetical protein
MKDAALAVFGERLDGLGFRRLGKRSVFAKENAPGIQARLNFNFRLNNIGNFAAVDVLAEVNHDGVEKTRMLITGSAAFTVLEYLAMLMWLGKSEEDMTWTFWGSRPIPSLADKIADACIQYGVPFLDGFRSLDDIIMYLESVHDHYTMSQSLAIAYCIQGRLDDAARVLAGDIDEARTKPVKRREAERYIELFNLPVELD